jgi:actin
MQLKMKDVSVPNSLVIDLGTAQTKHGWSNNGDPSGVFPSIVGRGRHKGAMQKLGLKDSYVGRKAQARRGILSLSNPIRNGVVENWDDLELLWEHIWETETNGKGRHDNDGEECKVLVTVPPLCPLADWRRMRELLLEGYGVGGIYLANKSVLSMYGGGRTTGVCVDSGEDMTYIVPCWEGSPLPDATLILRLGGKHVTERLLTLLSNGKYSFSDDTFLLWKRAGRSSSSRLTVASRTDVVREAKERFCKVSDVPLAKAGRVCKEEDEEVLRLPDGNIVVVGEEAYSAPELMFCPELSNKKKSCPTTGLADLVYQSVMRCEEKLRPRLLSNIMLTGGNSMLPGLDLRLQSELTSMFTKGGFMKKAPAVKVQAQEGREHFTWDGGAHLCSLSSFQRLWLTKQDYMETGATMDLQTGKMYGEAVETEGVTVAS